MPQIRRKKLCKCNLPAGFAGLGACSGTGHLLTRSELLHVSPENPGQDPQSFSRFSPGLFMSIAGGVSWEQVVGPLRVPGPKLWKQA